MLATLSPLPHNKVRATSFPWSLGWCCELVYPIECERINSLLALIPIIRRPGNFFFSLGHQLCVKHPIVLGPLSCEHTLARHWIGPCKARNFLSVLTLSDTTSEAPMGKQRNHFGSPGKCHVHKTTIQFSPAQITKVKEPTKF